MKYTVTQLWESAGDSNDRPPTLISSTVSIVEDGSTLLEEAINFIESIDNTLIMGRTNEYVTFKAMSVPMIIILTPIENELKISFDSHTSVTFATQPDSVFDFAKYTIVKTKNEMNSVLREVMGVS